MLNQLISDRFAIIEQISMQSTDILEKVVGYGFTVQDVLISTPVLVFVLALTKMYFRGARFTIPKDDLTGKYAVVTGGNSGIGAETVRELAKLGCQVLIGARNKETAERVIKQIRQKHPQAKIDFIPLDLASRASIESFAQSITYPKIDYLVNNAGLMAIPKRKTTKEGFEMQWGVNHLGHFLLTSLLWPKVTASGYFRIINVSSLAHKRLLGFGGQPKPNWQNINFEKDYDPNVAYSLSKLYNVLFTKSLSEKIGRHGLAACLHPGVVRTDLLREMEADGVKGKLMQIVMFFAYPVWWLFSKSSFEGSQTTLFTLLSDNVESGNYYADCALSKMNSQVTKENCDKLWEISQKVLNIKFDP